MCGITGIYPFNDLGRFFTINVNKATSQMGKRGPDTQGFFNDKHATLGHCRLSVIDTSQAGRQPMTDEGKRFTIVYNGEIYNYRFLRERLEEKGISFSTATDTEVLLKLYIEEGKNCLYKLEGFFAFAVYDAVENSLFLARDRYGIKPLIYYQDQDKFIFASEMKAILAYGIEKKIDLVSLRQYLHLNYIPQPWSRLENVHKLKPGHWMKVNKNGVEDRYWYDLPHRTNQSPDNYDEAKRVTKKLVEEAVRKRMVADVPLGSFLSGGVDSSIVAICAARETPHLQTFSIGYRDEPFFDETKYARLVAKKAGTEHHVFSLTNEDLFEQLFDMLDYLDEPFADSSALAVYILSQRTKKRVTVALSGDGADEVFGGYNKHLAEKMVRGRSTTATLAGMLYPFLSALPQSRNDFFSNKVRQITKLGKGHRLNAKERYYEWCGFLNETTSLGLLKEEKRLALQDQAYNDRKTTLTSEIGFSSSMNEIFRSDMGLVLPSDMLHKVDLMSMANSLEVRVPFLDHDLVDYAFMLPAEYKIRGKRRKAVLVDSFRKDLPSEIINRSKKGFEVPLLKWMRNELKSLIESDLLKDSFIEEQALFDVSAVKKLKQQLFSSSPGDAHATIWALLVFQYWWKKNFRSQPDPNRKFAFAP